MTHASFRVDSLDLGGMQRLADEMIRSLPKHLTIALVGTLGAGKTSLVQAIARAVDIDATDVTSPTFTLLRTHQGRRTLHHLDAYRVVDEDEFVELGVEELFDDESGWTLVEWADRVRDVMPGNTLWLEIKIETDPGFRSVTFSSADANLVRKLQADLPAPAKDVE